MKAAWLALGILALTSAVAAKAQPYELDGFSSTAFRLERLEIKDRASADPPSLIVPAGWRVWRDAKDQLRLGSADRNYMVELTQIAVAHGGDPAAGRKSLVDPIRRLLEDRSARDLRVAERGGTLLIEATVPVGGRVAGALTHSVVQFWTDPRDAHVSGFQIEVRPQAREPAVTVEIVRLFREQLLRGSLAPPPSVIDRLPPPRSEDRYDFRSLRPVTPFGFMALRVPSTWRQENDGDVVGYYDPRPGSPELWIGYHIVIRHHDRGGAVYRKMDAPYRRENKSDDRRRVQWMISDGTEDRAMILIVDLFMAESDADRPEFKELVQIVDEQLHRMRIGRPPAEKEATIETGKRPNDTAPARRP
ncbi:hypothetical protein [Desertibaculum subflavum]|uniref:hypothetical protein n=1 Tax=Desertibaculum subflavum TaxID=2268458 RepID=UPI000E6730B3